jgi:hypothetical protein
MGKHRIARLIIITAAAFGGLGTTALVASPAMASVTAGPATSVTITTDLGPGLCPNNTPWG